MIMVDKPPTPVRRILVAEAAMSDPPVAGAGARAPRPRAAALDVHDLERAVRRRRGRRARNGRRARVHGDAGARPAAREHDARGHGRAKRHRTPARREARGAAARAPQRPTASLMAAEFPPLGSAMYQPLF